MAHEEGSSVGRHSEGRGGNRFTEKEFKGPLRNMVRKALAYIKATFLTRDEFTVVSYPGPDRSVKTKELAERRAISRRYRNRCIGEFLKELDLTEGRGTGIPKILRAMKENGSPPPEFRTDEDHSFFATVMPVHPEARAAADDLRVTCGVWSRKFPSRSLPSSRTSTAQ